MKKIKQNPHLAYAIVFFAILAAIVVIALFIRDRFIRPYFGDILVTVLICAFLRIFFPNKIKLLPLWVFIFAAAVEVGQYFGLVDLLGLGNIRFFRIVLGTTFSPADLICYAAGYVLFWICEKIAGK